MKIVLTDEFPDGFRKNVEEYMAIKQELINTLSEKKFTISQTRHLFFDILTQFDKQMLVTTDVLDWET